VGFIRQLPHHLIASFHATLEEARQADLLLHVADASNPGAAEQIRAVYGVLEELGIQQKDTLLVLNKVDALPAPGRLGGLLGVYPGAVAVSARSGQGLDELAHAVGRLLSQNFLDVDVETGVDNGRLLAFMAAHGEVLSRQYTGDRVVVHCRMPRQFAAQINGDAVVRPHANGQLLEPAQP
jgi:GTP-binding protein HflX